MTILLIVGLIIILLFCGVVAFGAPYLPTLSGRVDDALDLLDLKPGQTMLELGCGDGRLLTAAAKRGISSVGYELNPLLFAYAYLRTWRYRSLVTVRLGDYWHANWPESDGMYVFLLQPYMSKLHKKVVQYSKGRKLKVVSFAFEITEMKPSKEINGMFLYKYNGRE
jgi:SAM-dependent methyltransferase